MKVFVALCVIALAQCGLSSMDSDEPGVFMDLKFETEMFTLDAWLYQPFPRDGEIGKTYIYAKAKSLGADFTGAQAFFGNVGNCSTFDPNNTEAFNVTEVVQVLKENQTDIEPISYQFNTTLFEDFNAKQLVGIVGGEKFCTEFSEPKVTGMKMLRMKFRKCESELDRDGIAELISKKIGVDKKLVHLGAYGNYEGCSFVDVYFNAELDGDYMLRKALVAFDMKNELGLYSPTDSCMTDVKQSFIVVNILKNFVDDAEKEEPDMPPIKTCAGMSKAMVMQYQKRLYEYDARVKAYERAYGESPMYETEDTTERPVATSCNCSSGDSKAMQIFKNLYTITKYVGVSLTSPEITMKKEALATLQAAQSVDWDEVSEVAEELKVLQEAQDKSNWYTHFGTCMVAARPDSFDKMEEIRGKLQAAGPDKVGEAANEILRSLLVESIMYSLENMDGEKELSLSLLRKKLQIMFGVMSSCSSEAERKRVLGYLAGVTESLPADMEAIASMIENENITREINQFKDYIMENKDTVTGTLFFFMYAPFEGEEDHPMYANIKNLAMTFNDNAEMIAGYLKEWVGSETDIDKLMAVQVMLLTKANIDRGCDLSVLANKIMAMTAPAEEPAAPETPCGAAANQREGRRQRGPYRRRFYGEGYDRRDEYDEYYGGY